MKDISKLTLVLMTAITASGCSGADPEIGAETQGASKSKKPPICNAEFGALIDLVKWEKV